MSLSADEKVHFKLEQIAAIEEAFSLFDVNNDGLISAVEFRAILSALGERATDEEIREKIRQWDGDGDGSINFAEFLDAMTRILTDTDNEARLREAFRLFDKDNNGFITPRELSNVMGGLGHELGQEEIMEMIVEADMDSDGKISFGEFKKLMHS